MTLAEPVAPTVWPSQLPDVRGPVIVDTEGDGLHADDGAWVSTIQVSWWEGDILICHGWPFTQDPTRPELSDEYNLPEHEWYAMLDWLETRDGLVFHNAPHDLGVLRAGTAKGWGGRDLLANTVWDTLLSHRSIEPGQPAGLEAIEPRLFGGTHAKTENKAAVESHLRKRKIGIKRMGHADWNVIKDYATGDVDITGRLLRWQQEQMIEQPSLVPWITWDHDVMRTLIRMERRGLPYDKERSLEIACELQNQCDELDARIPFKTTPNGAKEWFYDQCKATPLKISAKTRAPSLDSETVDALAAQGYPFAEEYHELCRARNAVSKWYQAFADATGPDGRLRCRFNQATVRSGRLSVGRVNLQAIPQDYVLQRSKLLSPFETPRQLIHAIPSWALWNMDEAQAELRVAALLADCGPMLEIIEQGRDPHGELAQAVFGVNPGDAEWPVYRQVGKRGNFSLIFGIGRDKLRADIRQQTGVDLGDNETMRLIRTWRRMYPQFGRAINFWQKYSAVHRCVPLTNGRKSYFADYELHEDGTHKAFNRVVQGSIGAFTQQWMVEADRLLIEALGTDGPPGVGLLLQIHDNLVPMVPDDAFGEALARQCRQIGIDLWPKWFTREDGRTVPGEIEIKRWESAA
jgi:DNA polymerase I-like protein with 3'-5' exonuclease and polymerase domains